MTARYTLISLKPSRLVHYQGGDYDFNEEDLLIETGLTLEQMETRVVDHACEPVRSCEKPYGQFHAFRESEENEELEFHLARVLEDRAAPVLARREAERKAKQEEEARIRQEERRARDLAELEALKKKLGVP